MKIVQTRISDELHRHLRKWCLRENITIGQAIADAIVEKTQFGQVNITIKTFPRRHIDKYEDQIREVIKAL